MPLSAENCKSSNDLARIRLSKDECVFNFHCPFNSMPLHRAKVFSTHEFNQLSPKKIDSTKSYPVAKIN